MKSATENRIARHRKIRMRMSGTSARPRLAVFRSNRFISAQLIDDVKRVTIATATDMKKGGIGKLKTAEGVTRKIASAKSVGTALATAAKAKKITNVVFDRAGFIYTGRVKALADAAREGGLIF